MASQKQKLVLLTGISLTLLVFIGISLGNAQSAMSQEMVDGDPITLSGTILSIDDHGFLMETESGDIYVPIPNIYEDYSQFNLEVGAEVTVTGYLMSGTGMMFTSQQILHPESINGIIVEHGDGTCDSGQHHGYMNQHKHGDH
jgi:hypothetical protein